MRAVFISDAHLKDPGDAGHRRLSHFFDQLCGSAQGICETESAQSPIVDHLIIAGDFFDFWFAKGGAIHPGFRPIVDRIAALSRSGVRISLCEGNHDFWLDGYFTGSLGITVYPEWADFEFDGRRILVSHGDTIDRTNRRYLALRRFLRSPFAFHLQRIAPLALLWRAARLSSAMSKEMSDVSQIRLTEIMYRFAKDKFAEGYDAVVLGHCHKPCLREEMYEGRQKTFATLGDWITQDSYLLYDSGRFTLRRFLPEE